MVEPPKRMSGIQPSGVWVGTGNELQQVVQLWVKVFRVLDNDRAVKRLVILIQAPRADLSNKTFDGIGLMVSPRRRESQEHQERQAEELRKPHSRDFTADA